LLALEILKDVNKDSQTENMKMRVRVRVRGG
jgi:hypothetical protein